MDANVNVSAPKNKFLGIEVEQKTANFLLAAFGIISVAYFLQNLGIFNAWEVTTGLFKGFGTKTSTTAR
jgi:hypothetical protein